MTAARICLWYIKHTIYKNWKYDFFRSVCNLLQRNMCICKYFRVLYLLSFRPSCNIFSRLFLSFVTQGFPLYFWSEEIQHLNRCRPYLEEKKIDFFRKKFFYLLRWWWWHNWKLIWQNKKWSLERFCHERWRSTICNAAVS